MTAEGWGLVITTICTAGAIPLAKMWIDSKIRVLNEHISRQQKEIEQNTEELGEVGYLQSKCSRRESIFYDWITQAIERFRRQDAKLVSLGCDPEPLLVAPPPPPNEDEERIAYVQRRSAYTAALSAAVSGQVIGNHKASNP